MKRSHQIAAGPVTATLAVARGVAAYADSGTALVSTAINVARMESVPFVAPSVPSFGPSLQGYPAIPRQCHLLNDLTAGGVLLAFQYDPLTSPTQIHDLMKTTDAVNWTPAVGGTNHSDSWINTEPMKTYFFRDVNGSPSGTPTGEYVGVVTISANVWVVLCFQCWGSWNGGGADSGYFTSANCAAFLTKDGGATWAQLGFPSSATQTAGGIAFLRPMTSSGNAVAFTQFGATGNPNYVPNTYYCPDVTAPGAVFSLIYTDTLAAGVSQSRPMGLCFIPGGSPSIALVLTDSSQVSRVVRLDQPGGWTPGTAWTASTIFGNTSPPSTYIPCGVSIGPDAAGTGLLMGQYRYDLTSGKWSPVFLPPLAEENQTAGKYAFAGYIANASLSAVNGVTFATIAAGAAASANSMYGVWASTDPALKQWVSLWREVTQYSGDPPLVYGVLGGRLIVQGRCSTAIPGGNGTVAWNLLSVPFPAVRFAPAVRIEPLPLVTNLFDTGTRNFGASTQWHSANADTFTKVVHGGYGGNGSSGPDGYVLTISTATPVVQAWGVGNAGYPMTAGQKLVFSVMANFVDVDPRIILAGSPLVVWGGGAVTNCPPTGIIALGNGWHKLTWEGVCGTTGTFYPQISMSVRTGAADSGTITLSHAELFASASAWLSNINFADGDLSGYTEVGTWTFAGIPSAHSGSVRWRPEIGLLELAVDLPVFYVAGAGGTWIKCNWDATNKKFKFTSNADGTGVSTAVLTAIRHFDQVTISWTSDGTNTIFAVHTPVDGWQTLAATALAVTTPTSIVAGANPDASGYGMGHYDTPRLFAVALPVDRLKGLA